MDDDEFDQLVDDATHAVNNLIPDRYLDLLDADNRSDLLFRINDALSAILRDIVELPLSEEDDEDQEDNA